MTEQPDLGISGIGQVRLLDSGGFADVYEARDEFGRRVAIKVLKALDEAAKRRFDRERSVMGLVAGHPNIVNPFTSGYSANGGRPYVVMEFLGGGSLQQRLDDLGPMPVAEAISIVARIADALDASHRAGIIHKDVKPANILLGDDGTPKLADFGIASIRDVTNTTALAYSPAYTPPETYHASAGGDLRDERSDLYSLGATLFALIVGRGPFLTGTESAAAAMGRILNDPLPHTGYPNIDQFLAVAMAKDPAHRYQDAASFARVVRSLGAAPLAPPVASPASFPPPSGPPAGSGASWNDDSLTVRGGLPPAVNPPPGVQGGYPAASDALVDSRPSEDNRSRQLLIGAVGAALLLIAGTVVAISLSRTGSDPDVATGPEETSDTESATSTSVGAGETTTVPEETSSTQEPTSTLGEPGDLAGTTVTIAGVEGGDANIAGIEGALRELSEQTGIDISYTHSADLISEVNVGETADVMLFAQPNVIADFARSDVLVPVPSDVATEVSLVWSGEWTRLGTVDGVDYGVPHTSAVKSLVWFKPSRFEELGYEVPQTWSEIVELTDQAIADGDTPWCVGIESGAATGWVFTDWVEDLLLRQHGAAVYDEWVAGDVRFSDPKIIETFDEVRDLWNRPGAVYDGGGSILDSNFSDAGPQLANDDCLMHRQADFFSQFLPAGTPFADGSEDAVDVFYLPSEDDNRPIVGAGTWAVASDDRPEVWVVMQYLGSADYANARQKAQSAVVGPSSPSGFLTAVDGLDRNLFSGLENSMLDILAVASPVRYDGSDSMPGSVGADTFWSEGAAFVNGDVDAATAASRIDDSWPR